MTKDSVSNTNFPKICIVMATYCGEAYLEHQIESHLNQTYPNLSFLYIDDASTDQTWEILHHYQQKDNRIQLLRNASNEVYISTFQKGILAANSELIALSDQDDIWLENKISHLFQKLEKHDLIYSDSELINAKNEKMGKRMSEIKRQIAYDSPLMYTFGAWAPGHSMLFNRRIIPANFKFPSFVSHDYLIGFLATCNHGMTYTSEPLVLYRQHNNNAIGANLKKAPKNPQHKKNKDLLIQNRIELLATLCPDTLAFEKNIFQQLSIDFKGKSLINRLRRSILTIKHREKMLAYKGKSALGNFLYGFKLLFKIY